MFKRIAIIGPYPPPYGGISVHIQRILSQLDSRDVVYDFYCENINKNYSGKYFSFYGKFNKLLALISMLFKNYTLIHHHSPNTLVRIGLCFIGLFRKNVYLHIHGASLKDAISARGLESFILKGMLRYVHVLADNEEIIQVAKRYSPRSITAIDAFLPPMYDKCVLDNFINHYKHEEWDNYDLILSMVGWFTYYNNEDLYGFDLLLEAVKLLRGRLNILVIVSINGVTEISLHESFIAEIKQSGLDKNFLLIYDELDEIWPVYIMSDMFIRPTNTDGNALSIKEALWFETPVIASDCVDRPQGTELFRKRDAASLAEQIQLIAKEKTSFKSPEEKINLVKTKVFRNRLMEEIYGIS